MTRRDVYKVKVLLGMVLQLGATAWADETYQPIAHPSWEESSLGRIQYSNRDNQRRRDEHLIYRLNEDGDVSGQDLLQTLNGAMLPPMDFERFKFLWMMGALPEGVLGFAVEQAPAESLTQEQHEQRVREVYDRFMRDRVDTSMATLVMARILDHEAMKRMMLPEVSNERVDYVVRSILIQNGLSTKPAETATSSPVARYLPAEPSMRLSLCGPRVQSARRIDYSDASQLATDAELYRLLKQTYGEQPLLFNIDWQFNQVGLGELLRQLRYDPKELNWPAVTLELGVLPRNLRLFRDAVKAKLDEHYRQILRGAAWQQVMLERNPLVRTRVDFAAPTQAEIDRLYPMLRETPVFKTERMRVKVAEVHLQGRKADEFKARLYALFEEKMTAYQQSLQSEYSEVTEVTPELEANVMARVIEWRARVMQEIFAQVRDEFAADAGAIGLSATIDTCEIDKTAAEIQRNAGSRDRSYVAGAERSVFNVQLFNDDFLPVVSGEYQHGGVKHTMVALLLTRQMLEPTFIERDDPRVLRIFLDRARSRETARIYRQTAYDLFAENPFRFRGNTCDQVEWPCATSNLRNQPVRWTDLLFEEFLYPEMTLPVERSRMPEQTTTLLRPEYFDRVMTLSTARFESVISAPNTHVDRVLRFFPALRQGARMSPERETGRGGFLRRVLGHSPMSCGPNGCGF